MISIARTFGAPETVPAGKPADKRVDDVEVVAQLAFDIRDDVHDVAVALDEEAVGDLHRADLGDAADVVAAEIEQHQMLGALLRVGEQLVRRALRPPPASCRASACRRSGGCVTLPSRTRTRISGLEHDDLEVAEIEKAQDRATD